MRLRVAALAAIGLGIATGACSAILGLQPPPPGGSDGGTTVDAKAPDGSTLADGSMVDATPAPDGQPADGQCVALDAALPPGTSDAATTFNPLADEVENAPVHTWTFFNVATVNVNLGNFEGGAFDGRYVYFVPSANVVARYDMRASGGFAASSSWSTFDVSSVNPAAWGFAGATFDGRYLYLVPCIDGFNNSTGPYYDGVVVRFDTMASGGFVASTSWATFDVSSVNPGAKGFVGAAFDGRFVYLVPSFDGSYDGILARFDTLATGGFAAGTSWSTFDVSRVNPGAKGFSGAVFDGRFLYLVPNANFLADGLVARFDTGACGMPDLPGWFPWGPGSFF